MAVNLIVGTNSYVSLEDANTYFNERLYAEAWTSETDDDKKARALITATRKIDRLIIKGVKADSDQTLQFPRSIYSEDTKLWVEESEVSQSVKDAVCEEALALLKGIPKRVELQAQGVKSFSLGSLSENYGSGKIVKLISQEARELLQPYIAGSVYIC